MFKMESFSTDSLFAGLPLLSAKLIPTKNAEHEETSRSKSIKVWLNSKQFIILKIFDTEAYFVLILL